MPADFRNSCARLNMGTEYPRDLAGVGCSWASKPVHYYTSYIDNVGVCVEVKTAWVLFSLGMLCWAKYLVDGRLRNKLLHGSLDLAKFRFLRDVFGSNSVFAGAV
jgi:hypothetical protein